ncbi:MAG: hypothetical protein HQ589_05135 [Syntrophaceae bacterium]|nr:hypothetical protein [Syntrophaceae bacterium]
MNKTFLKLTFLVLVAAMLSACGGLRYSQVAPDAQNFKPESIGVLPVNVGAYEEARGIADQIISGVLVKKGWFANVVSPGKMKSQMDHSSELQKMIIDYLTKLETVNFSDPALSKGIGESYQMEAFLVVNIDFWNYTVEGSDKVAKVGFSIDLVEAKTGKIVWKAGHHEVEDYWLMKPDLSKLAQKVASMMIDAMPH